MEERQFDEVKEEEEDDDEVEDNKIFPFDNLCKEEE